VKLFEWRRGAEDLRPTWEERRVALERSRDRFRRQQSAEARLRGWTQIGVPVLTAGLFVLGMSLAEPLLSRSVAARPELFAVQRLEIQGTDRLDPTDLARAAQPAGEPAPVTLHELVARLEAHPWVAHVSAARIAPDAVVARVEEHVPVAVAEVLGETPVLVDAAGIPFADAEGDEWNALPRLVVAEPPARGRRDALLGQGVALAQAVAEAGFGQIELALDGEDPNALPALRVAGVPARIVLGAGDPAPKLALLRSALAPEAGADAALAARVRDAREIDLRYAEQMVLRPLDPGPGAGAEGAKAPGQASGVGAPARVNGGRSGESRRPDHRG
jgi:cell division septal protein FtsQ